VAITSRKGVRVITFLFRAFEYPEKPVNVHSLPQAMIQSTMSIWEFGWNSRINDDQTKSWRYSDFAIAIRFHGFPIVIGIDRSGQQ
jgi:hypothetical protein